MTSSPRGRRSGSGLPSTIALSPRAIARDILNAALAADPRTDPVLQSPESRAYSLMQSVICRHGVAIQQMLADGIDADDRFEVFRDHPIPVCVTALECVSSRTPLDILKRMTLSSSGAAHHVVCVDLFVVNLQRGWAGVFDCKRGHASTSGAKRRSLELDLLALRMTLPSFARQAGFAQVDIATGGVIDYYGHAGFGAEVTVPKASINRLFEMPLVGKIDRMTSSLRRELRLALSNILGSNRSLRPTRLHKTDAKVVSLFKDSHVRGRGRRDMEPECGE